MPSWQSVMVLDPGAKSFRYYLQLRFSLRSPSVLLSLIKASFCQLWHLLTCEHATFQYSSMNWGMSKSLGPILGAVIFAHLGGLFLYLTLSCLLLVSGVATYYLTNTIHKVIADKNAKLFQ